MTDIADFFAGAGIILAALGAMSTFYTNVPDGPVSVEIDPNWLLHAPPRLARIHGSLSFGAKPSGPRQQIDCIDTSSVFENEANRLSIPPRRHPAVLRTSRGIIFFPNSSFRTLRDGADKHSSACTLHSISSPAVEFHRMPSRSRVLLVSRR